MRTNSLLQRSAFVCSTCRARARLAARTSKRLASTLSRDEIYDIVAVGGGPVGLALLAAISTEVSH